VIITLLVVVVLGGLAMLVVSENTQDITIFVAYFEVTTQIGIAVVAAFGFGLLTGLFAVFGKEMFVPPEAGGDKK